MRFYWPYCNNTCCFPTRSNGDLLTFLLVNYGLISISLPTGGKLSCSFILQWQLCKSMNAIFLLCRFPLQNDRYLYISDQKIAENPKISMNTFSIHHRLSMKGKNIVLNLNNLIIKSFYPAERLLLKDMTLCLFILNI